MTGLGHVAFDGLVRTRTVLGGVGVGETGPGGVITGFDGGEPGRANRETGGGVEIQDKGLDTWEIIGTEGLQRGGGGAGGGLRAVGPGEGRSAISGGRCARASR